MPERENGSAEEIPAPPPRFERLLAKALGDGSVEGTVLGDLREQFVRRSRIDADAARRWYRREALALVASCLLGRGPRSASAARGAPRLSGLLADLRVTARAARRRPLFVAIAVMSLAIGIGANAVMFSVFDTFILRPIPGIDTPDRFVELALTEPGRLRFRWSYPDFLAVRDQVGPIDHVAMYLGGPVSLSDDDSGERLTAMYVTSQYFEAARALIMGRGFSPEEDVGVGEHPVAVLSNALWQQRFDGDPTILGSTLRLNRETYTVVGITREFNGTLLAFNRPVFLPIGQHQRARDHPELFFDDRRNPLGRVVARLGEGSSVEEVDAALDAVFSRLAADHPETHEGRSARALSSSIVSAELWGGLAFALGLIAALTLLVLGVTCANLSGMILARAAARERELAVRLALGADRARVVRHLVTESMVIFVVGGSGGLLLAFWALSAFDPNLMLPTPVPVDLEFMFDARVFLYVLALTLGSGVLFGVFPALQVTRAGLLGSLREKAGSASLRAGRLRRTFIVGQVTVSILFLATAGLFVQALRSGTSEPRGFDASGIYYTQIHLAMEGYGNPEAAAEVTARIVDRLRAMPGVEGASVATDFPLDNQYTDGPVWPDSRAVHPDASIVASRTRVTPGYFKLLRIEALRGREFDEKDGRLSP